MWIFNEIGIALSIVLIIGAFLVSFFYCLAVIGLLSIISQKLEKITIPKGHVIYLSLLSESIIIEISFFFIFWGETKPPTEELSTVPLIVALIYFVPISIVRRLRKGEQDGNKSVFWATIKPVIAYMYLVVIILGIAAVLLAIHRHYENVLQKRIEQIEQFQEEMRSISPPDALTQEEMSEGAMEGMLNMLPEMEDEEIIDEADTEDEETTTESGMIPNN